MRIGIRPTDLRRIQKSPEQIRMILFRSDRWRANIRLTEPLRHWQVRQTYRALLQSTSNDNTADLGRAIIPGLKSGELIETNNLIKRDPALRPDLPDRQI